MASDFQITFWGTRGSIAVSEPHSQRFGGNTTCVTFKMGDKTLIIDAGTGIRAVSEDILSSMDKNRDRELYLFFSHMHWDHIQGFPFFVPAYMPDFTLNIFADEEKSENLQKLLIGQMHSQYFPVSFDYLEARMNFFSVPKELQMKDFSISTLPTQHPGGSTAIKVKYGGKSAIFATDVELNQAALNAQEIKKFSWDIPVEYPKSYIDFFKDTDLIIIDAQYTDEEYLTRKYWGHSSISAILWLSKVCPSSRVYFTHHDPMHNDKFLTDMIDHANMLAAKMSLDARIFGAKEGYTIDVSED